MVSPSANISHNVTLALDPTGSEAFNRTVTLGPGDETAVYRDHDRYRLTVVVDGQVVVDEVTLHAYESLRVEITADGNVTTGLSQV
jgi:hypothetical protein